MKNKYEFKETEIKDENKTLSSQVSDKMDNESLKKESNHRHFKQTTTVKKIAVLAILMALGVVFKFFSIGNGQFRISIWDLPLIIAGIIAGPLYGGICALGADLIYSLCFSPYPFSFIMMFTTIVWGVAGGLLYKKKIKIWHLAILVLCTSCIATGINSIYLWLYYGFQSLIAGLPIRLMTMIIKIPITTLVVYLIMKAVYSKLGYSKW